MGLDWDWIGLDGIRVVGGIEHLTVLIKVLKTLHTSPNSLINTFLVSDLLTLLCFQIVYVLDSLCIYALLSQNFVVLIHALFQQIF